MLGRDAEGGSARHEHPQPWGGAEQRDDGRRCWQHALEVVEHEQERTVAQAPLQRLHRPLSATRVDSERLRHGPKHEIGIGDRRKLDEEGAVREVVRELPRRLDREARLADTADPGERDEPHVGASQQGTEPVELALAPEEPARRCRDARARGRPDGGAVQRGILPQDRLLQKPQRRARLDAELLCEGHPRPPVRIEGIRLQAAQIERPHQLAPQTLAVRVLRAESLELADELAETARGKVGLDAIFERREPKLLEPGRSRHGESRFCERAECRASPERERFAQEPSSDDGPAGLAALPPRPREPLEPDAIDALRLDAERVAAARARDDVGAERFAHVRDEHVERALGGRRQWTFPKLIEQALTRHELVRAEQQ